VSSACEPSSGILAEFYDLRHGAFRADIPFYQYLAGRAPGMVLEIGCGTGRLLQALAECAPAVVGIDISPTMLARAKQRLARLSAGDHVYLMRGDARHLSVKGGSLAILALNTFCYFITTDEQLEVLSAIRDAVDWDGTVAIDVPNPHVELSECVPGACVLEGLYDVGGGTQVYEWSVTEADVGAQMVIVQSIYDTCEGEARLWRRMARTRLRLTYRFEMELLLRLAGFHLEAVFGDYDCAEYEERSPRMVVIARKR